MNFVFHIQFTILLLVFLCPKSLFPQTSCKWPINDSVVIEFGAFPPSTFIRPSTNADGRDQSISITDCNKELLLYSIGKWLWAKGRNEELHQDLHLRPGFVLPKQRYRQDSICYYLVGSDMSGSVNNHLRSYVACFNDTGKIISFSNQQLIGKDDFYKSYYSESYLNNHDGTYWIISTDQLDEVRCYKVSPSGIDSNVVVSKTGIKYTYSTGMAFAYQRGGIAVNHAGNKIVLTGVPNHSANAYSAYVLDFDPKTGKVDSASRKGILTFKPDPKFKYETNYCTYQAVFAPCDSLLYVTAGPDWHYQNYWKIKDRTQFSYIFQINMITGVVTPIVEKYKYYKENTNWSDFYSGMQMAPDGRLYTLYHGDDKYRASDLSVIHHSNRPYPYCDFQDQLGLPVDILTLPHSNETPPKLEFVSPQESNHCADSAAIHIMIDASFQQATFYFGDGDSILLNPDSSEIDTTVYHIYKEDGSYALRLTGLTPCGPNFSYLDTIAIYRPPKQSGIVLTVQRGCDSTHLIITDSVRNSIQATVRWGNSTSYQSLDTAKVEMQVVEFMHTIHRDTTLPVQLTIKNKQCSVQFDTTVSGSLFKIPIQNVKLDHKGKSAMNDTMYLCYDEPLLLIDSTTNVAQLHVNWGDGSRTTISDSTLRKTGISKNYSSESLYQIIASDTNFNGCYISDTFHVRVLPKLRYQLSLKDSNVCGSTNFFEYQVNRQPNASGIDSLIGLWVQQDSLPFNTSSYVLQALPFGLNKIIHKSITAQGCIVEDSTAVNVFEMPTASLGIIDSSFCANNAYVEVENQSLGDFNLTNPSFACLSGADCKMLAPWESARWQNLDTGVYQISLNVVSKHGCKDSTSISFRIFPKAIAALDSFKPHWCFNDQPVRLYALKGDKYKYFWNWTQGVENIQVSRTFANAGKYSATLYVENEFGCGDSLATEIEVLQNFDVNIIGDDVCENALSEFSVEVNPPIAIDSVLWFIDNIQQPLQNNLAIGKLLSAGNYNISLIVKDTYACSNTDFYQHTVHPTVTAEFEFKRISEENNFVLFQLTDKSSNSIGNLWQFDNGIVHSNQTELMASFPIPDSVSIDLIAYNGKCSDTISSRIAVLPEGIFLVPSAFSPNNDGLNDVFKPFALGIKNYKLEVYNSWGQLIYEGLSWDGTYEGKAVPMGSYLYSISGKTSEGKNLFAKGSVMVVR